MNQQGHDTQESEYKPPEAAQPSPVDLPPAETEPAPGSQPSPEQPPMGMFKRYWKFAAGFLGWFLVNGLYWWWLLVGFQRAPDIVPSNCIILTLNVLALILLIKKPKTRQITWGGLTAIAVNLFVSLMLGLFYNAFCLVPFFN